MTESYCSSNIGTMGILIVASGAEDTVVQWLFGITNRDRWMQGYTATYSQTLSQVNIAVSFRNVTRIAKTEAAGLDLSPAEPTLVSAAGFLFVCFFFFLHMAFHKQVWHLQNRFKSHAAFYLVNWHAIGSEEEFWVNPSTVSLNLISPSVFSTSVLSRDSSSH